jgi:hypothetical protein
MRPFEADRYDDVVVVRELLTAGRPVLLPCS